MNPSQSVLYYHITLNMRAVPTALSLSMCVCVSERSGAPVSSTEQSCYTSPVSIKTNSPLGTHLLLLFIHNSLSLSFYLSPTASENINISKLSPRQPSLQPCVAAETQGKTSQSRRAANEGASASQGLMGKATWHCRWERTGVIVQALVSVDTGSSESM